MEIVPGIRKCPKCGKKPNIKYGYISFEKYATYTGGHNYFYIKCCNFFEYGSDKSYAKDSWNREIKRYNKMRENMKFEILNENIDQKKEKILFKLEEVRDESINVMFKKSSDEKWKDLLVINQDGSISLNTINFNRNFIKDCD